MSGAAGDLLTTACAGVDGLEGRAAAPEGDGSWMRVADLPGTLPGALDLLNAIYGSRGHRTPAAVLQATLWWTVGAHAGACLVAAGGVPAVDGDGLTVRLVPGMYGLAPGVDAAVVGRPDLAVWLRGAAAGPLAGATAALAATGGARERLLWAVAYDELVTAVVTAAERAGWTACAVAGLLDELAAAAAGTPLAPRSAVVTTVVLDGTDRARWERVACCRRFDLGPTGARCRDCPAVPPAERHHPA